MMMTRFLGCGAAANLLAALVCGILLYGDGSNEALIYLLAGFGLGWWGTVFLGCFLLRLAALRKPRNTLMAFGGGLFLALCIAVFIWATLGNSNAPTVLLVFGGGSLIVAGFVYIAFWGMLESFNLAPSRCGKTDNNEVRRI